MRTLLFKFGGEGSAATLALHARSARGGQSQARFIPHGYGEQAYLDENGEAKKRVSPAATPAEMAAGLAKAVNDSSEFAHDHVTAEGKGDMLLLSCSDIYADTEWLVQIQGGGGLETVEQL